MLGFVLVMCISCRPMCLSFPSKFYMFKKFKYFLNKKAKLDVVKAMILSYFMYSNIFYEVGNIEE